MWQASAPPATALHGSEVPCERGAELYTWVLAQCAAAMSAPTRPSTTSPPGGGSPRPATCGPLGQQGRPSEAGARIACTKTSVNRGTAPHAPAKHCCRTAGALPGEIRSPGARREKTISLARESLVAPRRHCKTRDSNLATSLSVTGAKSTPCTAKRVTRVLTART